MSEGGFRPSRWCRWGGLLLLGLFAWCFTGCATNDADAESERPWNAPQSWETGLPPQMYERR